MGTMKKKNRWKMTKMANSLARYIALLRQLGLLCKVESAIAVAITRFFFKFSKITWKIRNLLNRKKNKISDFYFSSYGHFCTHNDPNFRCIFTHNSKNKNRTIFSIIFTILYSIFCIFHTISTTSEGGRGWGGGSTYP